MLPKFLPEEREFLMRLLQVLCTRLGHQSATQIQSASTPPGWDSRVLAISRENVSLNNDFIRAAGDVGRAADKDYWQRSRFLLGNHVAISHHVDETLDLTVQLYTCPASVSFLSVVIMFSSSTPNKFALGVQT